MESDRVLDNRSTSEPAPSPEKHTQPQDHLPKPGSSILWLLVFTFLYFAGAVAYITGYSLVTGALNPELTDDSQLRALVDEHAHSITAQIGIYCTQFVLLLPVILWAANFRSQSWRETLALKPFKWQELGVWLLVFIGYLTFQGVGNYFVPVEPGPFLETISNSQSWGLAFTMVVLAPILEELIFRGYLFQAWRHTALGLWGTLIATSLLFSVVHFAQYHWILGVYLFTLAMILGLAREKTRSVWVPVIIHGVNNLIAAIMVVFLGIV